MALPKGANKRADRRTGKPTGERPAKGAAERAAEGAAKGAAKGAANAADSSGAEKRHARGFLAASACARRAVGEAAAGRGFAEPQVLTRWSEIVGDHLAGLCLPV